MWDPSLSKVKCFRIATYAHIIVKPKLFSLISRVCDEEECMYSESQTQIRIRGHIHIYKLFLGIHDV